MTPNSKDQIDKQQLTQLADMCSDFANLLRDTTHQDLLAWRWVTSQKAAEIVDTITILQLEHLMDE